MKKGHAMPGVEPLAFNTNLPRIVVFCKFFLTSRNACKEILLECDACEIVVVLAVDAFLAVEAVLFGIH